MSGGEIITIHLSFPFNFSLFPFYLPTPPPNVTYEQQIVTYELDFRIKRFYFYHAALNNKN